MFKIRLSTILCSYKSSWSSPVNYCVNQGKHGRPFSFPFTNFGNFTTTWIRRLLLFIKKKDLKWLLFINKLAEVLVLQCNIFIFTLSFIFNLQSSKKKPAWSWFQTFVYKYPHPKFCIQIPSSLIEPKWCHMKINNVVIYLCVHAWVFVFITFITKQFVFNFWF